MKRTDPYIYTRGQWKHNELLWSVLAVLDIANRMRYPPLPASAIQKMIGCNIYTLWNSLRKWEEWGWVKRYQPRSIKINVKPIYTYRITPKGKRRMHKVEWPQQRSTLTFKAGVDRDKLLSRIKFFNEKNL